jgi:hypothetical protein
MMACPSNRQRDAFENPGKLAWLEDTLRGHGDMRSPVCYNPGW